MVVKFKKITGQTKLVNKSIEEVFGEFIKSKIACNLSAPSIKFYRENYGYFAQCVDVKMPIASVNILTIEEFIVFQKNKGTRNDTSINSSLRSIRAFLYWAMDKKYLSSFKIKKIKQVEKMKEPYTSDEMIQLTRRPLSNNFTEWRNWTMVNYLMDTGNRALTVASIKVKDFNIKEKQIFLGHNKNGRAKYQPLSDELYQILNEYLNLWAHEPSDPLFPAREGGHLTITGMQSIMRRYCKARGVEKNSLHLFRHYFAKNFIKNGGDMYALKSLLGHSTLDMTIKYVALYDSDMGDKMNAYSPLSKLNIIDKK